MLVTGTPAPLTAQAALTTWAPDVLGLLVVAAAGLAYGRGVRAVRRAGARWPAARTVSFAAGLLLVVLATCSALGVYARVLFWVYVVQACLLLLVAPLLLGAGAPLGLAAAAATPGRRARIARWTSSWPARAARVPGFGPAVLIAATAVLFFTPLLTLTVRSDAAGEIVRLALLAAGLVVALPVTDEHASLSSVGYAAALGLGFAEFLLDAVPGIVLRLQGHALEAAEVLARSRSWGPGALADQQLAGAWLWFFAEAGDLPFLAALVVAWVRSDAREASAIDRALDERDRVAAAPAVEPSGGQAVRRPGGGAGPAGAPAPAAEADRQRPWWESDPSVFGEARARRNGWGGRHPDGG